MIKKVVFADLDGTFLNDKYEYAETKPIVDKLSAFGCSVVFCSSKTREEIEFYRKATGINEPFISENGAAIFIPKHYFPLNYNCYKTPRYNIIRLGTPYKILRKKLSEIKEKTSAKITGFGDMSLQELAFDTGLPMYMAKLAQKRENDEPFRIIEGKKASVLKAITKEGLSCSQGGRYFHLMGDNDKGKAVNVLKNLYSQTFGQIETIGVGDGPNDIPMLKAVDKPFLITKKPAARLNAWLGILESIKAKTPLTRFFINTAIGTVAANKTAKKACQGNSGIEMVANL
jgi:mannosyl-3-phosphoglycerate phosphatase